MQALCDIGRFLQLCSACFLHVAAARSTVAHRDVPGRTDSTPQLVVVVCLRGCETGAVRVLVCAWCLKKRRAEQRTERGVLLLLLLPCNCIALVQSLGVWSGRFHKTEPVPHAREVAAGCSLGGCSLARPPHSHESVAQPSLDEEQALPELPVARPGQLCMNCRGLTARCSVAARALTAVR